jgi:hypothetical protein
MRRQRASHHPGRVKSSSCISQARAWTPLSSTAPHISTDACSCPHTAGRSGRPKILQRSCSSSCTQGTPAGLPWGMPGMGEEMDGAVQQAAQPGRQVKGIRFSVATVPKVAAAASRARPAPRLLGLTLRSSRPAPRPQWRCQCLGPTPGGQAGFAGHWI